MLFSLVLFFPLFLKIVMKEVFKKYSLLTNSFCFDFVHHLFFKKKSEKYKRSPFMEVKKIDFLKMLFSRFFMQKKFIKFS
jgi:hypothetical protein